MYSSFIILRLHHWVNIDLFCDLHTTISYACLVVLSACLPNLLRQSCLLLVLLRRFFVLWLYFRTQIRPVSFHWVIVRRPFCFMRADNVYVCEFVLRVMPRLRGGGPKSHLVPSPKNDLVCGRHISLPRHKNFDKILL